MASANRYPELDERLVAVVRYHARRTTFMLPELEIEDVEQELLLHVHRRMPAFRPERAGLRTFVDRVARHRGAKLIEAAVAAKRRPRSRPTSLSAPVFLDEEEGRASLAETITIEKGLWVDPPRPPDEAVGLRHDLARLLQSLSPKLRHTCLSLAEASVADVARETGRGRSSIYEALHRVREICVAADLDDYLERHRTVPEPSR